MRVTTFLLIAVAISGCPMTEPAVGVDKVGLEVSDGQGNFLGYLMEMEVFSRDSFVLEVFNPDLFGTLIFGSDGRLGNEVELFYLEQDCGGQAYTTDEGLRYRACLEDSLCEVHPEKAPPPTPLLSMRNVLNWRCTNLTATEPTPDVYEVAEIEPPFAYPIQFPLQILTGGDPIVVGD